MCGLPATLSVVLNVAVRDPAADGLKVMFRVIDNPGLTVTGVVTAASVKSLAFVPKTLTPLITRGAVPGFDTVIWLATLVVFTSWPGNVRGLGLRLIPGSVPVPERLTTCGLPVALSVIVNVPLMAPVVVGVNVTLIVQVAPAAIVPTQLLV